MKLSEIFRFTAPLAAFFFVLWLCNLAMFERNTDAIYIVAAIASCSAAYFAYRMMK